MTDTRLVDLEVRYTHLEKLVQELSEVVWRQQKELDALKLEVKHVSERAAAADPGLVDASRVDLPPHY